MKLQAHLNLMPKLRMHLTAPYPLMAWSIIQHSNDKGDYLGISI
jgi:hypothetical protein